MGAQGFIWGISTRSVSRASQNTKRLKEIIQQNNAWNPEFSFNRAFQYEELASRRLEQC
jgi:hypothetical protein